MHVRRAASRAERLQAGWLCMLAATACAAGADRAVADIVVTVLDEDDVPVENVAVYAVPLERASAAAFSKDAAASSNDAAASSEGRPTAVMDQVDNAFVPHVLVVQTGTDVAFPNSDSVSHHVYSFSDPKRFELPLYKGNQHPPLRFDTPGIVVLGCNIHDGMLGYILVVDTPWSAVTGADGNARLDGLPEGAYAVHVWTPRARHRDIPAPRRAEVRSPEQQELTFAFKERLMPAHDHGGAGLTWDRY